MPEARRTGTRARLAILGFIAVVLCLLIAGSFLKQERCIEAGLVLVERASLFAWAALILLAALSFGCALLRWLRLRPEGNAAAALFGLGAGLAALSALCLALGSVGMLEDVRAVVVLMALLVAGMRDLGVQLRALIAWARRARAASWFRVALWTVLAFFLALNLTRAFEPPWEYDVLEYHLAAPAAYHEAGRVFFMRDNVYANFPQNDEMLDMLAMNLTGSPDRGATVGKLLGAAFGFLAALALGEMVAGVAGKEAGAAAAALFYVWPGITLYSGVAYVELPLMFYAVLALWGLLWSWRRKRTEPGARGWVLLSAIATGAALGVKYTAALLVFVPALLALAAIGCATRAALKETARRVGLYAGVSILCFSPWLIRNYADTRNPVYPLLYRVFGSSNWDGRKDARFMRAHSAPRDLSPASFLARAREVLFVDNDESPSPGEDKATLAVFLFVPLALLADRRRRGIAVFLAAGAALLLLLWFLFTQQNVRFAELVVPVLAALSAVGLASVLPNRHFVGLRHFIILLLLFEPARWINYLHVERSLGCALGVASPEEFFRERVPQFASGYYSAMRFLNDPKNLPPGSKVLFLGEARTFYCRRPCVAATVFDTNLLEEIVRAAKTPEDIRNALKALRITHLYVDTEELERLQRTYSYTYHDAQCLGTLNNFNWGLFGQFAAEYLHPVWAYPPQAASAPFPWERWPQMLRSESTPPFVEIYELR